MMRSVAALWLVLGVALADDTPPAPISAIHDAPVVADALHAAYALTAEDYRAHGAYIERELRRRALQLHRDNRHATDETPLEQAAEFYALYAAHFEEHENIVEMRYAFGELLYELGRYADAHTQYTLVVDADPQGKRAKFCATSAIHAAQRLARYAPNPHDTGDALVPFPMTEWEAALVVSLQQFIALYPDDEETTGAIYKIGYLLHTSNHYDDAEAYFAEVIAREPGSPDAENAATLVLDGYIVREDWPSLRDTAARYLATDDLGDESFQHTLSQIVVAAEQRIPE